MQSRSYESLPEFGMYDAVILTHKVILSVKNAFINKAGTLTHPDIVFHILRKASSFCLFDKGDFRLTCHLLQFSTGNQYRTPNAFVNSRQSSAFEEYVSIIARALGIRA